MKLSELLNREILNLRTGEKLGKIGTTDFLIDANTGRIKAILFPRRRFVGGRSRVDKGDVPLPWEAVRKVSEGLFLVEFDTDTTLPGVGGGVLEGI